MKVLVTGGAGYIGAPLVSELLKKKYEVTVLDAFFHNEESLPPEPGLKVARGDVRDESTMLPLLKEADIIIPLAGIVGAAACDRVPATSTEMNLGAIQWMMKQLSGRQQVCFPSTFSVYGHQEAGSEVDERTTLQPLSLYARDKIEAEKCVLGHPNSVVLRLAPCFGVSPRFRMDLLVNELTFRAFTKRYVLIPQAHVQRTFLHVRDAASAFVLALKKWDAARGEIFNVGNSEMSLTKWQLAGAIQEQLPDCLLAESTKGIKADPRDYRVSLKVFQSLGFQPKYSLKAGIAELIHGFLARGATRPTVHRDNK